MVIIVFLTSVAFFISAYLSGFSLYKNPKERVNRLLSILSSIFAIWFFGMIFSVAADTRQDAELWIRIATFGWYLLPPLFFHFILTLSSNRFFYNRPWLVVPLYAPSVCITILNIPFGLSSLDLIKTSFGWASVQVSFSTWNIAAYAYSILFVIPALFILHSWSKRSGDKRYLSQSRIITGSTCLGFTLYAAFTILPPAFELYDFPGISHLFILVFHAGIAWAIIRYKLISLSPQSAARSILNTMADGVLLLDTEEKIVHANPAACRMLHSDADSLLLRPLKSLLPILADQNSLSRITDSAGTIHDLEVLHSSNGSEEIWLSLSASAVLEGSGDKSGSIIVLHDISERKQAEKQLRHLATHDVLTNLPNRTVFNDRLKNAMSRAQRHKLHIAVLLIDIDRFKDINDVYGHDAGDIVLRSVATRLESCVREYDTVSRLGGDEFIIVISDLKEQAGCKVIIDRIREKMSAPVVAAGCDLSISLSIGISFYPENSDSIEGLYKLADDALYQVKSMGRNGYRFYTPAEDIFSQRMSMLEADLKKALLGDELEMHFEPIYDLGTGRLEAMEATLKWLHPELGFIPPGDFIPIAERSGLILKIGDWTISTICREIRTWSENGFSIPCVVAISPKQLADPILLPKIEKALKENSVEPSHIELQLSESTAMLDMEKTISTAELLKQKGIHLIIDDFCSGYSSMIWLKHLNVSAIRIGRLFTRNISRDKNDIAIVRTIVSMAHAMGIRVIAEGVETEEQLEALRSLQRDAPGGLACDYVQGFLLCKPVSAEEALELLKVNAKPGENIRV